MIPSKTIEELITRHNNLEKDLSSSEIDKKLFAEKSKEYSDLNEVIDFAREYNSFDQEKKELEKILNDSLADEGHRKISELDLDEFEARPELNEIKE